MDRLLAALFFSHAGIHPGTYHQDRRVSGRNERMACQDPGLRIPPGLCIDVTCAKYESREVNGETNARVSVNAPNTAVPATHICLSHETLTFALPSFDKTSFSSFTHRASTTPQTPHKIVSSTDRHDFSADRPSFASPWFAR